MRFVQNTPEDQQAMLQDMGLSSLSELFHTIPEAIRYGKELNIPTALSEQELLQKFGALASQNKTFAQCPGFLGAGNYYHHIPAIVDALSSRGEFLTAYTPYQGEASQGMLQVIFEFQTLISRLTGLPVSNASLYDGATACAEGVLLALAEQKKRKKVLVSAALHPEYVEVVRTYVKNLGDFVLIPCNALGQTDPDALQQHLDDQTACFLFQTPNFFGCLEEAPALCQQVHQAGALVVSCHYPVALGKIAPPGEWGSDIAVGEIQAFGTNMAYGGAHCGFISVQSQLIRRLPGRLVGLTKDQDGKRAFVLTLQTREQHIKRERATSNICTNQALIALRATIHMCSLGKQGLLELADLCMQKAHYAARQLEKKGLALTFPSPFFNEFVVELPHNALEVRRRLMQQGILSGLPLSVYWPEHSHRMLFAFTEMHSIQQIDQLISQL